MRLLEKLSLAEPNAAAVQFTRDLFAGVEGFDFAAALAAGQTDALRDHIAALQTSAAADELAAANEKISNLSGSLAAVQDALATLDALAAHAGVDMAAFEANPADAFAAAFSDKVGKAVLAEVAALGLKASDDSDTEPTAPQSALEKYSAMQPGEEKRAFLKANQAELIKLAAAASA